MDKKDLKKLLAGMSLVALVGGAGLSLGGCAATQGSANSTDRTATEDEWKDPTSDDLTG